jgi:endonuclease-3
MNKDKAKRILELLKKHYPNAKIILNYNNNFELLVAVMLSAQTTDIQVNKVTASLFPRYRKGGSEAEEIERFANANINDLEKDISSVGLYKTKAKNIKLTSHLLLDKFNARIPKTIAEMLTLPGVGRKTANVVLGNAYGIVEGIAVDTHVKRLSQIYKFTKKNDPDKIEQDLMRLFDRKDWFKITYLLIEHGREIRKTKKDFILEINEY